MAKRLAPPEGTDTLQFVAIRDVLVERARQDAKWGEQNHEPFLWLTVLMEEVGELAEAALHTTFGGPAASGLRDEAIQVAAVAVAMVECLDRAALARRPAHDDAPEGGAG